MSAARGQMTPATGRPELERWLTAAPFNAYFRFRLREFGPGECTIEAPFRDDFERPGGAVSGPVFMAAPARALVHAGPSVYESCAPMLVDL